MSEVRAILIGAGVLVAVVGGMVLLNDIPPRQYPAIIAWLVVVLIAHDVVIAGVVFAVAFAGRRVGRRMPLSAVLIAQSALAVGGIMALLVVPEIVKKAAGTANPSVLPLAYGLNLAVLLAVLAVVACAAIVLHALLSRQRRAG
jgi:hypothetical protein